MANTRIFPKLIQSLHRQLYGAETDSTLEQMARLLAQLWPIIYFDYDPGKALERKYNAGGIGLDLWIDLDIQGGVIIGQFEKDDGGDYREYYPEAFESASQPPHSRMDRVFPAVIQILTHELRKTDNPDGLAVLQGVIDDLWQIIDADYMPGLGTALRDCVEAKTHVAKNADDDRRLADIKQRFAVAFEPYEVPEESRPGGI